MCRQAWFPPGKAARDPKTLKEFLDVLEKSAGGHGNGVAWVTEGGDRNAFDMCKGQGLNVETAAEFLAKRPDKAWGIFHTRWASIGERSDRNCHPHRITSKKQNSFDVLLTHNGTWAGWRGVNAAWRCSYRTDSVAIAGLLGWHGWNLEVVSEINQTICAAIWNKKTGWIFRAWKNTSPLQYLDCGAIASEGTTTGEFKEVCSLDKGSHDLRSPIVTYLDRTMGKTRTVAPSHESSYQKTSCVDRRSSSFSAPSAPGKTSGFVRENGYWRRHDFKGEQVDKHFFGRKTETSSREEHVVDPKLLVQSTSDNDGTQKVPLELDG